MGSSFPLLALAVALSFGAGFSLHRGGICAVRAVRDVVEHRRWERFVSFIECAAWALAILLLAQARGAMVKARWPDHQALPLALLGGVLFGIGALINGACAFGSAGRLAAGDMSFLALPPGFILGALGAAHLGLGVSLLTLPAGAAMSGAEMMLAAALVIFVIWRLSTAWRSLAAGKHVGHRLAAPAWPPYTTLLLDVALRRGGELELRALLVFVFLAGAFSGALSAGRFRWRGASPIILASRFGGGMAMGFGAALIPGGNDALVLLGLPLLQPTAVAAYIGMIGVIALGLSMQRHARRKLIAPNPAP